MISKTGRKTPLWVRMRQWRRVRAGSGWFLPGLLLALAFAACQGNSPGEVYRPAAPDAALAPIPSGPVAPAATPAPVSPIAPAGAPTAIPPIACANNLRYLEDLTIPDGSSVMPGQVLDKRWRVHNNGTCDWGPEYRLRLASGPDMGAAEQALFPAHSGAEALIRIQFTAPSEPGLYRSAWQAFSPEGEPFGEPVYIEILVP